jgi:hypothetical protein
VLRCDLCAERQCGGPFHLAADGILSDVSVLFDTEAMALGATLHGGFARLGDVPILVAGGFGDRA